MALTRRDFVRGAGLSVAALLAPPGLQRTARAATSPPRAIVMLFLRGGADGLSLVVPQGDAEELAALRPVLSQGVGPTHALDGFFELHRRLEPLQSHFQAGDLAIVHAVGGTGSYSHFEATDALEAAQPLNPATAGDGWLFRAVQHLEPAAIPALTGVSLHPTMTDALRGPASTRTVNFPTIKEFAVTGDFAAERASLLRTSYANWADGTTRVPGKALFDLIDEVEALADAPSAPYPGIDPIFEGRLADAARLVKAESLGVRAVALDLFGWDNHADATERVVDPARILSEGLATFMQDLGPAADRTLVLVLSEFGRAAAENGTLGTDHGWATFMLALGGGVTGGRVLSRAPAGDPQGGLPTPSGRWPGLAPHQLHVSGGTPRDLDATTDFRDVYGEVLQSFLGLSPDATRDVLRGYTPNPPGLFT